MAALLHEAIHPNLVQTADGGPVIVHGGPFANIAHGCNSRIATRMGLAHADIVVTEAGFGFELGAEKYLHIKARSPDLWPSLVALVVTQRAIRWHGEGDAAGGLRLLEHELACVARFGLPAVVVLNAFPDDDRGLADAILRTATNAGAAFAPSYAYVQGAEGCLELADVVAEALQAAGTRDPQWLYPLELPLPEKIERVARALYAADGVVFEDQARKDLARIAPLGNFPVCIAKTPASLTGNPKLLGYRQGHTLEVHELRLQAGAGFVVALAGEISTMPGLPAEPNAWNIRVEGGRVVGLEGKG
jgi:formate--tetrahydrofolate ligase